MVIGFKNLIVFDSEFREQKSESYCHDWTKNAEFKDGIILAKHKNMFYI